MKDEREFNEEDDGWLEAMLDDDELTGGEAGFLAGYRQTEQAGFEESEEDLA